MRGLRGLPALCAAGAALLLLSGCAQDESIEDAVLRAAVLRARERNGVTGVAIGLLTVLALRHLVLLVARARAARRARSPRPTPMRPAPRPGPPLVAAALAHELLATAALWAAAYVLGYLSGPVPAGPDDDLGTLALGLFFGVSALVAVPVVVTAQLLAARLPYAREGTFHFLAVVHALVGSALVVLYLNVPDVLGVYLVPVPFAAVAAGGFWWETRRMAWPPGRR